MALLLLMSSVEAAERANSLPKRVDGALTRLRAMQRPDFYKFSVVAVVAATAADSHSSWGAYELNPVLRGAGGRFDGRSALIKGAIAGGWLVSQRLFLRRHPDARRIFARVNFSCAAATGAIAARNYAIR